MTNKGGYVTHGLGRKPFVPDARDWPVERVKAMVARGEAVPLTWSVPRILDQDGTPECVSAGILGALDCDDAQHNDPGFTSADIDQFFHTIPGAGPDGAYVRDGLKAAKAAGYIAGYSLLRSEAEIIDWLENDGPVVFGSDWLTGMDNPDAHGYVLVSGSLRGGHCYYGNGNVGGYDLVNSWGEGWGQKGHFYMTQTQFHKLLQSYDTEVWAIVQPAPQPPKPQPSSDPFIEFLRKVLAAIEELLKKLTD